MKKTILLSSLLLATASFSQSKNIIVGKLKSPTEQACGHLLPLYGKGTMASLQQLRKYGPALTYTPFEMADYPIYDFVNEIQTGTGAKPGQILTLPLRQFKTKGQISYKLVNPETCEYYSTLNGMEAWLNTRGVTLRDKRSSYKMARTKLPAAWEPMRNAQDALADSVTDTIEGPGIAAAAEADLDATYDIYEGVDVEKHVDDNILEQDTLQNGILTNATIPAQFGAGNLHQTSYKNEFNCTNLSFGDRNLFEASIGCNQNLVVFNQNATQRVENGQELLGNLPDNGFQTKTFNAINADVYIFNNRVKILDSEIEVHTYETGEVDARVEASFRGFDFDIDDDGIRYISQKETIDRVIDRSVTIDIPLGIIKLKVKVGATGTSSLTYKYAASGYENLSKLKPGMGIAGYAEVGVDLLVVGAGVGGKLTILEDEMTTLGKINIDYDFFNRPLFSVKQTAKNTLSALDGKIYVYAFINVPRIGLPPWVEKRFEYDLFKFNGYSKDGTYNAIDESFGAFNDRF